MSKPPSKNRKPGPKKGRKPHPRSPQRPFQPLVQDDQKASGRSPQKRGARNPVNQSAGSWIYGRHAGIAALVNPARKTKRILVTESAARWLRAQCAPDIEITMATPEEIDTLLPVGATHQGLAVEVVPLSAPLFEDICTPVDAKRPVVILDQITDPQNIGAIFRTAAAFGARAIVVQDRRTPPLTGALAKAAAGAVERVPCCTIVNIARSIETLQELGYFCVGLAGEAEAAISQAPKDMPIALVMGAEGAGLRQLVAKKCDLLARIPIAPQMESLNVSSAAAIALYELSR